MSGSPEPVTTPDPQPVDESEPVPTAVTVIDALGRYLADEQLSEKAPPGLDRALDSLSSSNAISRAFQHAGFWTWYTYFLATDHIKESVSQLTPEALQHVVAEVSKVQPHASVANRVNHIFLLSDRGPKRCSKSSRSHFCHKLTFQGCFHPTVSTCPLRQSQCPPIRIPVRRNAHASKACDGVPV